MVTLEGAKPRSFARSSTAAPRPVPSAARSGSTVRNERLLPEGALTEIWTSPPYNHCMFTARPDLDLALERQFADALSRHELRQSEPSRRARR